MGFYNSKKVSDAAARKFLGAACALDAESTLSNVTSIQSQLLSLYETCDDTLKLYDKFSNSSIHHAVPPPPSMATAAPPTHPEISQHRQTPIAAVRKSSQQQQLQQQSNNQQSAAAAAEALLSPTKSGAQGSGKTATILVSKSKTKTGLPLLLKNSIN